MPDEQDSGPEHLEAVPSSHPLNGPDQGNLIDPQNLRSFEAEGVLEVLSVVVEDLPDGEGPDPGFLGQLAEGVAEGLFLKPGLEPGRHEPLVVYGGKWLIEGPSAGLAPEASGIDGDPDPFPVNGEVPDPLLPASEADQGAGTAMNTSVRRRNGFRFDLIVPVGILDLEDAVGRKIQNIGIQCRPNRTSFKGERLMTIHS